LKKIFSAGSGTGVCPFCAIIVQLMLMLKVLMARAYGQSPRMTSPVLNILPPAIYL
jgi:hypothetical protein